MILISDDDFIKLQKESLKQYNLFLEKIKKNSAMSSDFDKPKIYISKILSYSLIGLQEYENLFLYVSEIFLNDSYLMYFGSVHSKDEVRSFLRTLNI